MCRIVVNLPVPLGHTADCFTGATDHCTERLGAEFRICCTSANNIDFGGFVMLFRYANRSPISFIEGNGRGGIRTHGGLPHARFRVECLKPDSATLPAVELSMIKGAVLC